MNHNMTTEIYLDSNIYISIANREPNYEYTVAKLNNLKKHNAIFPHAPPHAEEISARIHNNRGIDVARRFINMLKKYNGGFGYVPGVPNLNECLEQIRILSSNLQRFPSLLQALQNFINVRDQHLRGERNETHYPTRLVREDFYSCLNRVDAGLDLTDFAKRNDIFFLGRRNEKTIAPNFESINEDHKSIETFDKIQKKYNLGPRRLSNIEPQDIFKDSDFLRFVRDEFINNGKDFDKIPSSTELIKSHHQKESIITIILNSMEKAGYSQEDKNHEAALTGRLHDVSHAIYASRSSHFVTNDVRFSKKVIATYLQLGIPTKVINKEDLLNMTISSQHTINLPF